MTIKFTQKEFTDIIKTQEKYYSHSIFFLGNRDGETKLDFYTALKSINSGFAEFLGNVVDKNIYDKVMALANPYTRDLVKGDLVEEEEKFLFTKIQEIDGETLHLNMLDNENGDNHIYLDSDDPTPLTIQQVEDYGYNLNAFTKTPYEYGKLVEEDVPF